MDEAVAEVTKEEEEEEEEEKQVKVETKANQEVAWPSKQKIVR